MKKILSLVLAVALLGTVSFGQVFSSRQNAERGIEPVAKKVTKRHFTRAISSAIFSEDFEGENALDNWTLVDVDNDQKNWFLFSGESNDQGHESAQCASSASWQANPLTPNNWMISPAIEVPNTTSSVNLEFWVKGQDPAYAAEKYSVYLSSGNTVADFTGTDGVTLFDAQLSTAEWVKKTTSLNDYKGQTIYIAFRHHDITDMFRINIDDVVVKEVKALDAKLLSLDLPTDYLDATNAMVDVKGTIENTGSDSIITSYDVTYKIDGGEASAVYSVTGVNIEPGTTAEFTHNVQADLSAPAAHEVEVTISNVNGHSDLALVDTTLSATVITISESVQKKVFFELFTSATCGPCASANPIIDDTLLNNNQDKAVLIKYQVNWPTSGDPYYTAEAGARVQYYGVTSAPTMVINGIAQTNPTPTQAGLNALYDGAKSLFKLEGEATYADDSITANINVTPIITFNKNLVLQVAVIEKETTGNVASNGETEFHNVMMKFVANTDGNAMSSFEAGTAQTITAKASLANTNIEEKGNIKLVVWIQDPATKEVYQASYVDLATELKDVQVVSVSTEHSACDLPSDAQVKAVIKNKGSVAVSNFTVAYTVNGEEVGTYTYAEELAIDAEAEIAFEQTANFSEDGEYNIDAKVTLADDVTEDNNMSATLAINGSPSSIDVYTEDFAKGNTSWATWMVEDANGDNATWSHISAEGYGHNDNDFFIYLAKQGAADADDYLYTTCLDAKAGKTYALNFWYKVGKYQTTVFPEKLKVLIGNAPNKEAMTTEIVDLGEINNDTYLSKEVTFTVEEDGVYYIAFNAYSVANHFFLAIDDVSITDKSGVDVNDLDAFKVYPNPTNGQVQLEGVENSQVAVYNMLGQEVYNSKVEANHTTIDLSAFSAGGYIVKVTKGDSVSTKKVVLTK